MKQDSSHTLLHAAAFSIPSMIRIASKPKKGSIFPDVLSPSLL